MKDYLVDVPVKINIWIREECQRKQFEVIKKARPSILFIQSDGGRNPAEWEAINNNRKMIDSGIDWKCKVFRLYEDTNQGLYTMGHKITTMIWENVDRCIFLEDDIIPSVSYFRFCAELLEKYKDDTRIQCICGMNHLGIYDKCTSDYFFCGEGSIWGVATWKRVLSDRDSFDYYYDSYSMKLLKQVTKEDRIVWDRMRNYPINKYYQGHTASGEFWIKYGVYAQHRLQIIPAKNMISNLGCTDNSEHSSNIALLPKGIRRVFNMKTYEIGFPLKHPICVVPDKYYENERNKIMAHNKPIRKLWRNIQRMVLLLFNGRGGYLINKIIKKFNQKIATSVIEK